MMNFKLRIYGRPVSGAAALDVINPGLAEAPRADLCNCSRRRRQGSVDAWRPREGGARYWSDWPTP
jgi:hypothetical protein